MAASVIVRKPFTNRAFGFPRGQKRRVKPVALACIHITGNRNTSEMDEADAGSGARAEWSFANRKDSPGPSAHLYVARDGSALEAINPTRFAAWSNGDINEPDVDNPGIARVLRFRNKGFNANEAYWEEIECVGAGKFPLTRFQVETVARRIAHRSQLSGLPINRNTVHGHWQINGVNRQNCPAPRKVHGARLQMIIERAQAIAASVGPPGPEGDALRSPAAQPAALPFGAQKTMRGTYRVVVSTARQRSRPIRTPDNIVGTLPQGATFQVGMTTERGELVGGSSRWHGSADGKIWMHSSVIRLSQ
jgi:hypothetical protein